MSGDGPIARPDVQPLDDIILGDEDGLPVNAAAASVPDARADGRGSVRPQPAEAPASPAEGVPAVDAKEKERKRAKLTLRIPDDEVSRPLVPAATPIAGIPAVNASSFGSQRPRPTDDTLGPPLQPQRIVSLGSADDTMEIPARAVARDAPPMPGVDPSVEAGWTPFQPAVERDAGANAGGAIDLAETPIVPSVHLDEAMSPSGDAAPPATDEAPSPGPISEDIPVDVADEEELLTTPRLALDSEEIRVEDGDRVTDPAEAPELAPEDLISVESLPNPNPRRPPPPKGQTATALMAGAPTPSTPPSSPTSVGAPSSPSFQGAAPSLGAPSASVSMPPISPAVVTPAAVTVPQPYAVAAQVPTSGGLAMRRPSSTASQSAAPPTSALAPPPMSESAANRKKIRPWWEELFNDDFIRTMAKVTDAQINAEVTFIEESLGCEAGATILDLACGTGQHAIELASRGYQVVGFDLSLPMLARAADEAQDRSQKLNFVQGDMREMLFEDTFDGVYCWGTSFGFFDEEKNNAVIAKVHRSLKKGGQFLLDVVNRDYMVRQAPSLAWFEGDGCICMDEMQVDFITSRLKVKRTLMMDDGRTKEIEYGIRVYALHELGKMLHDNGFRVAEVSGRTGTPGVFFGCESPRTLILAEKR